MCQIPRGGNRAFHGRFAIFQQRVHLIDKGLDFTGILSRHPPVLTCTHGRQFFPQSPKRQQTLAHSDYPARHENDADDYCNGAMRSPDGWKNMHHRHHEHVHQHEHPSGPQNRGEDPSGPKRSQHC
jgi:hypothetical protein